MNKYDDIIIKHLQLENIYDCLWKLNVFHSKIKYVFYDCEKVILNMIFFSVFL